MRQFKRLRWSGLLGCWLWVGTLPLAAQDLRFTPVEWSASEGAPDVLPEWDGLKPAQVPAALRELAEPAYAQVHAVADENGKVIRWSVGSTNPLLEDALRQAYPRRLDVKPARREGKPVLSEVRFFLLFNPASSAEAGGDVAPRLQQVIAPAHPLGSASDLPTVVAHALVQVDARGRVTEIAEIE